MSGNFALQIAKWVEKTKGDLDKTVRFCALSVDGKLIFRSPVGDAKYWIHPAPKGYVGGRFRGAWMVSIGSPNQTVGTTIDPAGDISKAAHASVIAGAKAGDVIYLQNNLPYANRIEKGWSRQAPVGLVALTVVEWNNIVDAAVNGVRSGTSADDFAQGYQSYSP